MPETTQEQSERISMTLDVARKAFERMRYLKNHTGLKTNGEVIQKGLQVLDWLLEKRDEGYSFQLAKDEIIKEVELDI